MAAALNNTPGVTITFSMTRESVAIAYAIGVLLTLSVVAFSAWRVSRMNIVTAIRNLPDPPATGTRRTRWLLGAVTSTAGVLLAVAGVSSRDAITLGFGVLLIVLGLVPIARALGLGERLAYTAAGLVLVAWFVLPMSRWLFGDMSSNFSIFVLAGLAIVVGASWAIMYNADVLLAGSPQRPDAAPGSRPSSRCRSRIRCRTGSAPVSRWRCSRSWSSRSSAVRSRRDPSSTGSTTSKTFGGGFDVRATTSPASPIGDMRAALRHAPGVRASDITVVSNQSLCRSRPTRSARPERPSRTSSTASTGVPRSHELGFAATARGLRLACRDLARHSHASRPRRGRLTVAPRRSNFSFGSTSKFRLQGFYLEDGSFTPFQRRRARSADRPASHG